MREALRLFRLERNLEIVSVADLPSNTGLGSSGSFTVGLLPALHLLKGDTVFHMAAHADIRASLGNHLADLENNIIGVVKIVKETASVVAVDLPIGKSRRIEWNDMNKLLKMALRRGADWILFQDSDETLEPRLRTELTEMVKREKVGMYRFKKYWL